MSGPKRQKSKALIGPVSCGLGLSVAILALVFYLALRFDHTGKFKYQEFLELPPSQMGDTLAGVFASLAFVWIVATVLIQSTELREQREVFLQQKEEFELMVKAQNAQVDALKAQTVIFDDEKRRRDEAASESYLAELLKSLEIEFRESGMRYVKWYFPISDQEDEYERPGEEIELIYSNKISDNFEIWLASYYGKHLVKSAVRLHRLINNKELKILPIRNYGIYHSVEIMKKICDLRPTLSKSQNERLQRLNLEALVIDLMSIFKNDHYWQDDNVNTSK